MVILYRCSPSYNVQTPTKTLSFLPGTCDDLRLSRLFLKPLYWWSSSPSCKLCNHHCLLKCAPASIILVEALYHPYGTGLTTRERRARTPFRLFVPKNFLHVSLGEAARTDAVIITSADAPGERCSASYYESTNSGVVRLMESGCRCGADG